jgi:dehydrogenase/reductase SDR family protein 7B
MAVALSKEGAKLILSARREEELRRVQQACVGESWLLPMDIGDLESLPDKARQVLEQCGQVDVLVNNAGIGQRSLALETDPAVDQRIMQVNYFGTIALTKAVLPGMVERHSGQIVVISSVLGKLSTQYRSAYAASKHALHGYFDSLRSEIHPYNVRVTIICPGWVRTNISVYALKADGSEYGQMDKGQQKGMPPDVFARKALHAIAKSKEEVCIAGIEGLGVYLKRFFPALFSFYIKRANIIR